jgi:hypothetical protein
MLFPSLFFKASRQYWLSLSPSGPQQKEASQQDQQERYFYFQSHPPLVLHALILFLTAA